MALVCLCNGVSERKVRKAIAHGATTIEAIGAACRAGTTCGGCRPTLQDLLDEHVADTAVMPPRPAVVA